MSSLLGCWKGFLFQPVCPQNDNHRLAARIATLHQDIMEDHQKTWYQVCNQGFHLQGNPRYESAVREVLEALTPIRNPVIADPLLCFLAPAWKASLDHPVIILHYSHPMECAHSLQKKWRFPLQFGLALWEYYVVCALAQMQGERPLLFSLNGFRKSPADYMASFADGYRALRESETHMDPELDAQYSESIAPPEQHPDEEEFLGKSQRNLFEALESGDLDNVRNVGLSAQASDLLFHYGNLRSGFDAYRRAGATPRTREESATPEIESSSRPSDPVDFGPDDGDRLIEVRVHIDGLPPQEFLSGPDNPVLQVLSDALQNQSTKPDDVIYLQSAESESGAIYFSAGDLLAVETQPL